MQTILFSFFLLGSEGSGVGTLRGRGEIQGVGDGVGLG